MKIREGLEADYAKYKEINNDPYGGEVVRYGAAWADLMESRLADGEKLEDIAEQTSREADTGGITGYMYGAACSALAHFWIHGEPLRRWHNIKTQIGHEGEKANESGGTLNPALLNIGDGE